MKRRRNFSQAERIAVYRRFNGICQGCGKQLKRKDKWEADHVIPYAKGGKTVLSNAQLLCRICNEEKGDNMQSQNRWSIKLRDWQERAFQKFIELYEQWKNAPEPNRRSALFNCFPGSGKTIFSLRVVHDWINRNHDKKPFVIVIVPKTTLTKQFSQDAGRLGIRLSYQFDARKGHQGYKKGIDGLVLTYSRTDYHRGWLKSFSDRYNLLVIMDECHHVAGLHPTKGDAKAWGEASMEAFNESDFFVLLTGTAWRSDSHQISFARYKRVTNNQLQIVTDFDYSYANALADTFTAKEMHQKIAREILFVTMGGEVEFMYGDEDYEVPLTPELEKEITSPALRSALSPTASTWFTKWFTEADEQLVKIRNDKDNPYPDASGLVIASSVDHMEQYADIMEQVTGERPYTVSYLSEDAEQLIDDYKKKPKGKPRWIVSVQMISEGVDIPRLAVLFYATIIRRRLFFYQAVGRVIRWDKDGAIRQQARVYIPFIDPLVGYAQDIKNMVDAVINLRPDGGGGGDFQQKLLAVWDNEYALGDILRTQGDEYAESLFVEMADSALDGRESDVPNERERLAFHLKHLYEKGLISLSENDKDDNETDDSEPGNEVWDEDKVSVIRQQTSKRIRYFCFQYLGVDKSTPEWVALVTVSRSYLNKRIARVDNIEQCNDIELKAINTELDRWFSAMRIPATVEQNFKTFLRKN